MRRFQLLYDQMHLNMKGLAAFTNFDTSSLYRIKSGERKASNLPFFCDQLAKYLIHTYSSEEHKQRIAKLLSVEPDALSTPNSYYQTVLQWLFNKKWMFAIACAIKKGLHLNMIHSLDRPFDELLLGLEAWIPIYMTGQVSPYYLPKANNPIYHHLNYVSGVTALCGESIEGAPLDGKYTLTNNKEELLIRILAHNNIAPHAAEQIQNYRRSEIERIQQTLDHSDVIVEAELPSAEDYDKHPMSVCLSGCFYPEPGIYSYEEMLEHFEETKAFANAQAHYRFETTTTSAFRNIQIEIVKDRYVRISKIKSPSIHFVIRHPKLVHALQHFTTPVIETA